MTGVSKKPTQDAYSELTSMLETALEGLYEDLYDIEVDAGLSHDEMLTQLRQALGGDLADGYDEWWKEGEGA